MAEPELDVVTGAYSFTGKYIAQRLLTLGRRVKTLTGHPGREHPFGETVPAEPFRFDDPAALAASLEGAATLYNTYWIRFEYGGMTFDRAVANTEALLRAAAEAGVRRVVHISIAHADEQSPFPYYRAKWKAEQAVRESGLPWAIIRPTVLFGAEAILFNNIAWLLRKFPVFAVPGSGDYRLQPVCVEDVAELAVTAGAGQGRTVVNAAGPETYTFDELIRLIAKRIGARARLLHVKPERALHLTRVIAGLVDDVLLTEDEVGGLRANLLVSPDPPTGRRCFSEWLTAHADRLGRSYFSELQRHFR